MHLLSRFNIAHALHRVKWNPNKLRSSLKVSHAAAILCRSTALSVRFGDGIDNNLEDKITYLF